MKEDPISQARCLAGSSHTPQRKESEVDTKVDIVKQAEENQLALTRAHNENLKQQLAAAEKELRDNRFQILRLQYRIDMLVGSAIVAAISMIAIIAAYFMFAH